jgi:MFS family permease
MTTAYTIGSTLGPALGGKIAANGDFYRGAYWAIFGSIVCIVLSWTQLPVVPLVQKRKDTVHSSSSFKKMQDVLAKKHLWPYLGAKFCSGVASSMYQTTLPLALTQNLYFNSSLLGLSMSCSAALVGLFSAFALKPLTSKVGTLKMMLSGLMGRVLFISLVALAVTVQDTTSMVSTWRTRASIVASVCYSVFSHILATSMTTQTTGMVDSSEQGTLMGIEHGIFSIARIIGPPLGAYIFTAVSGSFWSIALSCITIDGYLLYFFLDRFSTAPYQTDK